MATVDLLNKDSALVGIDLFGDDCGEKMLVGFIVVGSKCDSLVHSRCLF